MRTRSRFLAVCSIFALANTTAGCSLLVDFDESKIPPEQPLDGGNDTFVDAPSDTVDSVVVEDAGDTSIEDSAMDSDATDASDASDASDATDAADADAADASDADAAETCTPVDCTSLGATCGSRSDGCGGTLNCDDGVKNGTETDIDCGGASSCVTCTAGKSCLANSDCASANCVDGVCCDTACTGQCEACNVAGSVGTCTQVVGAPVGGRAVCAGSGTCAGSCVAGTRATCTYPTTSCRAASCAAGVATLAATCDGAGACPAVTTSNCGAYTCDSAGTACNTTCATSADCAGGSYCSGGACVGLKPNGDACSVGTECTSGNCVDGVCCNTSCTGVCQSCTAAKKGSGADGICGAISSSTDPDNECTSSAASTCGQTGSCDGAGACQLHPTGTSCAAATCTAGTLTSARSCDGAGTCATATTSSCGAYTCNGAGTACNTTCASDADCSAGNYCSGGACLAKLTVGAACSTANSCSSGNCVDGVCCNTSCGGVCEACSAAKKGGGSNGTCGAIALNTDPDNECATSSASSCGQTGSCNGAGACSLYPSGTSCSAATCSGGSATAAGSCNGSGTCVAGTTFSCGAYTCNGAGTACNTACASDTDCASGNYCNGSGACVAKLSNGGACSAANECSSANCVDGVCCNTSCTGACTACNVTGSVGTCSNVPAGATDGTSCAAPNKCTGTGSCVECLAGSECSSGVCTSGVCQLPSCTDGVKNGSELGVDCGGSCAACPSLLMVGGSSVSTFGAVFDASVGTWSASSIGGATNVGVDLAVLSNGTGVGVMRLGSTGALQYTTFDPVAASWATFANVATGVTTRAAPSVSATSTIAHVGFHGDDFKFYYAAFSGGTFSPTAEAVGTVQAYGPTPGAIAARGSDAAFVYFDGAGANDLYFRERVSGTWSGGTSLASGADFNAQPAIVTRSVGGELVVFRGTDNALRWTSSTSGVWSAPTAIPSATTTVAPALAALDSDGAVLAFRGTDGNLYASFYSAGSWGTPGLVTNTVDGVPSVVRGIGTATAEIVFINTEDSAAYHSRYIGGAWSTPVSVGGSGVTGVAAASIR